MARKLRVTAAVLTLIVFACVFATAQGRRPERIEFVNGNAAAENEVLVKFRQLNAFVENDVKQKHDAEFTERLAPNLLRLKSHSKNVQQLIDALSKRPDVEYVEPNYQVHTTATVPNDPSFTSLWGMRNTGQVIGGQTGIAGADIDAQYAWDISKGTTNVVVGVVDTGVDYTHPDLSANIWSAPTGFTIELVPGDVTTTVTCAAGTHGYNAITGSCDPMDDHSHGSHVSGTIGGVGNNGLGVAGVNWTTRIMGLKFLDAGGSGYTADAIKAFQFAIAVKNYFGSTANVRVLSNSWGGGGFEQAMLDAINDTNAANMLFVAAAGNNGSNNDFFAFYPANYGTANEIAVAATDNRDQKAGFSNYGATKVNLGAPGVNVLSSVPGASYAFFSGTSMATPHVSGVAALVLSRCDLTTAQLKTQILSQVDLIASMSGITTTGGRLNAYKAIRGCAAFASPISLAFGSVAINTSSTPKVVTVTNNQNTPLNISSISIPAPYSQTNNCPASMAAKTTCTINVVYSPTATGTNNATLSIISDGLGSPFNVAATGLGVVPVTVSPTSLSYGNVAVNTPSALKTVKITNNLATAVSISGISIAGSDYSQTNDCPASLAGKAFCTVSVTFTPSALGTRTGTLTITHDQTGSPVNVSLTGIGVIPVTVSPTSLSFGNVAVNNPSAAKAVKITNNLSTAISITGISITGSDYSQTNTCPASLAGKAFCTINVVFTPSATGTRTGTLTISHNQAGSPVNVSLTGVGVMPVTTSPTSLTYSYTGLGFPSASKNVTVTNNLTTAVSITGIAITGDFSQVNSCPASLPGKTFCTVTVTFTPTALGTRTGVLTISHSAPNSPATVNLTGTGQKPVYFTPTTLSFPNTVVGATSAPKNVTITNYENVPVTISSISNTGDFAWSSACGTLNPGQNCVVAVTFTPTVLGTRTGTLTINHNGVGSPAVVNLTGPGTQVVTTSPTMLSFGTITVGNTSAPKNVTLYNNQAGTTLSIASIGTSNSQYAVSSTTCGATLAPASNCVISVTFTPSGTGTRTGTLTIIHNAVNSPTNVSLTGVGQ